MHQFWSNGLVGQDIGLWYSMLKQCGMESHLLLRWASIGWTTLLGGPSPQECFNEKLFREGAYFRGDADTTLQTLTSPLLAAFAREMLVGQEAMGAANEALWALVDVTCLLQRTKLHPRDATHLNESIQKYKQKWDVAYAAIAGARPKFHYSLHLQAQIQKYRRHIDCFVGERKHRVFKSIVAPRLSRLGCFSRSTLLQLTEIELTTSHPESEYSGRLVGKSTHDVELAKELGLPHTVAFAKGIQIHCVEYSRGTFVQVAAKCCIEVVCGLLQDDSLSVVVQPLQPRISELSIIKWERRSRGTSLQQPSCC